LFLNYNVIIISVDVWVDICKIVVVLEYSTETDSLNVIKEMSMPHCSNHILGWYIGIKGLQLASL